MIPPSDRSERLAAPLAVHLRKLLGFRVWGFGFATKYLVKPNLWLAGIQRENLGFLSFRRVQPSF